jgi:hypothetical protein
MKATLYDYTQAYYEIMQSEDPQSFADTLDAITDAIEVKAHNSLAVGYELEDYIEACKKREEQFKAKRQAAEKRLEWLKGYWLNNMTVLGKDKIKTDLGTIQVKLNPHSVHVLDQSLIPSEYITTKIEQSVDKVAIKERLKGGCVVPGAELVQGKGVVFK